ncbi:MAG: hypothetical protein JXK95_13845 [Bacteroidales bacterium]|nr:hypothetical protein [Bacteroidales bacterium]
MTISNPKGYFGILFFLCLLFIPSFVFAQLSYIITDQRDGKAYKVVKIGEQWWMAGNLNIGEMIRMDAEQKDNDTLEKYCPYNDDDYCEVYGGLYRYDEMMQYGHVEFNQGICPAGWHIPSDNEWKTLELYIGMSIDDVDTIGWRGAYEGGLLKEVNSSTWAEPNACATDEFGFKLLPAGFVTNLGGYASEGYSTFYYCADMNLDVLPWLRSFSYDECRIYRDDGVKTYGHSVRCLKDSPYIFGRGLLTDTRDGQEYRTVLVGNRWWMAKNLNYGTWINTPGEQTDNDVVEKYCYNNEGGYCKGNGGLYQWDEMMNYDPDNKKGICPDGWHIPTEDDWKALEYAAGMPASDLDKTGWDRGSHEGEFLKQDGGSGFEAQLGGYISYEKRSLAMNEYGFLWASDQHNDYETWIHCFYAESNTIGHNFNIKQEALSVRCVSDNNEILTLTVEAEESVCAGQEFTLTANVSGGTEAKSLYWTSDPPGFYSNESIVQTRADTTTRYQVRVIDGVVLEQASVIVNVIPLPEFTVTGERTVCSTPESIAYTALSNPDYEYFWSQEGGDIISEANQNQVMVNWGENPGIRMLNVQVNDISTGCSDSKSIEIEILQSPPKPEVRLKGEHLLICVDSGRVYQWYQNDVAIPEADKQFYYARGNKSGSFLVETRLENQCINRSDLFTFSTKSTGDSDDELQTVFIRPNPSRGIIIMDIINDYTGQVNIIVANSTGVIISQHTLYKQTQVLETGIDLGELAEGLYFVIVHYSMNTEVQKLTVQH